MEGSPQQPGSETESLRERLSQLSEASLRINESLDFPVTASPCTATCMRAFLAAREPPFRAVGPTRPDRRR